MVIDGQSLAEALNDHRSLLSDVAEHCEAVVCCRMSPLQKAEVFVFLSILLPKCVWYYSNLTI